jgi:hypothetical protein
LVASYASLYLALFAADPSSLKVVTCHVDVVGALYFSTVTAATVGFGDVVPVSDVAQLLVVSEIFMFVTLFALFIQNLRVPRSPGHDADKTTGRDM